MGKWSRSSWPDRCLGAAALGLLAACRAGLSADAADWDGYIAHAVHFELKDDSSSLARELVEDCLALCAETPGAVSYTAGTRLELDPTLGDPESDVTLFIVFRDRAAHDAYQVSDSHLRLVAEYSPHVVRVRVFDTAARLGPVGR